MLFSELIHHRDAGAMWCIRVLGCWRAVQPLPGKVEMKPLGFNALSALWIGDVGDKTSSTVCHGQQ